MNKFLRAVTWSILMALVLAVGLPASAAGNLVVFNWEDYIDEEVLELFMDEYDVNLTYVNFTTNEEMYAKIAAGAATYDVLFPSDYIIERMIQEDMLAQLNFNNMPNAAGLIPWLKTPDYDPNGEYSVAYMWGTVGITYNKTMVEEPIDSWTQMFSDTYKNNVFMMDSIRDTLGVTLKMLGYSMNTRNEAELEEAKAALIDQKARGIVKAYQVDETKDKMVAGEAALALMWSGDAMYAMSESEDLAYVVPKEGSNVWIDGMVVPKNSQNKENAEKFIDFLCRPDIARMNMDEIGYCTPIQQVVDEMSDEEKANTTLNPPQDVVDRCEFFHDTSDAMELYDRIWTEVRSAR